MHARLKAAIGAAPLAAAILALAAPAAAQQYCQAYVHVPAQYDCSQSRQARSADFVASCTVVPAHNRPVTIYCPGTETSFVPNPTPGHGGHSDFHGGDGQGGVAGGGDGNDASYY